MCLEATSDDIRATGESGSFANHTTFQLEGMMKTKWELTTARQSSIVDRLSASYLKTIINTMVRNN